MRRLRSQKSADRLSTSLLTNRMSKLRSIPVGHATELAEFVGRILGDGSPLISPTYCASEIESQRRMQLLVSKLFGYCPDIKVSKGNYRIQLKRICGYALRLLGIPFGRKAITNPSVPRLIMESQDSLIWRSFLRGIFDDEACVSSHGIEIGLAVRQTARSDPADESLKKRPTRSKILDGISELLNRLGIRHTSRRGQVYSVGGAVAICWFIRIPPRQARKVLALGLFLLPKKLEKLQSLIRQIDRVLCCMAGLEYMKMSKGGHQNEKLDEQIWTETLRKIGHATQQDREKA